VSAQLARVARLERAYGDLDALHEDGGLDRLQQGLTYSKEDERAGKPSPAAFAIDGNLYNGLASVRKTIDYYRQFIGDDGGSGNRRAHLALIARLTLAHIEATMDDCDAAGVDKFLRDYGYVRPSNWAARPLNGQRYPAKAIVGVAVGKLPEQAPLRATEYFGGFGESQSYARLKELGYTIIGREESAMAENQLSKQAVEAAMDEYDGLGRATFLTKYERGLQGTRYWIRRNDTLYPSKAIANAAFEIQQGERG
jgi:5-methylcytosine-specific restriction protein B